MAVRRRRRMLVSLMGTLVTLLVLFQFSTLEENTVDQVYIFSNGTSQENSHRTVLTVVDIRHNVAEVSTNLSNVGALEAGIVIGDREASLRNDSSMIERYVRKMRGKTVSFSEMESMLLKGSPGSSMSVKGRGLTARDRELFSARMQIESAPVLRNVVDLDAALFRNVSVFKRSYELMDRTLKIYTYKEGEKPIFHQPKLRGLYAAEGWFMKLLQRSTRFSVRDPKKAHLFYLPFSSDSLRSTLYREEGTSHSMKDLEHYLMDYVNLIKTKYRFWNRTRGGDHFLVACHDWAPRITREHMNTSIRALCNANVARGFNIGKDVSVPVTYIRSGNDPTRDIGGKPSSDRPYWPSLPGASMGTSALYY